MIKVEILKVENFSHNVYRKLFNECCELSEELIKENKLYLTKQNKFNLALEIYTCLLTSKY